jgi:hypothetical protein
VNEQGKNNIEDQIFATRKMDFLSDFFSGNIVPTYVVYIVIGVVTAVVLVVIYVIYKRYSRSGRTRLETIPPEKVGEDIAPKEEVDERATLSCNADRLPEWRYGEHQVYYYPVAHEYTPLEADLIDRGWTQQRFVDNVPVEQKLFARQWFERQSHYTPRRKGKYQSAGVTAGNCECLRSGFTVQPFTAYQSKIPRVEINPDMTGYPIDREIKDIPALSNHYTHEPCEKFYSYQRPSDNRYHVTETVS